MCDWAPQSADPLCDSWFWLKIKIEGTFSYLNAVKQLKVTNSKCLFQLTAWDIKITEWFVASFKSGLWHTNKKCEGILVHWKRNKNVQLWRKRVLISWKIFLESSIWSEIVCNSKHKVIITMRECCKNVSRAPRIRLEYCTDKVVILRIK